VASIANSWAHQRYKPTSIPSFVFTSLLIHAVILFFAYKAGVFSDKDINSMPAKIISVSLVEPTPIVPPPKPKPKPIIKPIKKRKIVTQAPAKKTIRNVPKPVKKVVKPAPPKVVKKIASSPLPTPVKSPAAFASPQPTYQPKPKYPTIARRRGIEGSVILDVFVANNGHVTNALITRSSGSSALDRSALKAIKTWQFPASQFNSLSSFKQKIEFRLNRY
jgi:protein TonB